MKSRKPIAVIAGKRTPMAKAFSDLSDEDAVGLGVHALLAVVKDASRASEGFTVRDIDEVVFGNVAGPPDAANIARVIALKAGLPVDRVAHTVNRNCASGMESILAAWDSIETKRSTTVLCGGTESMTQIPMLFQPDAAKQWLRLARSKSLAAKLQAIAGFRPRHFKPIAGIQLGLTDPVSGLNMGETAEVLADEFGITREDQDEYALQSHLRGAAARERCFLSGEIAPITSDRFGRFEKDNGPRENQSLKQLAKLRPIFQKHGTVTPGNSCPLTDGAAALLLSELDASRRFEEPLGYITHVAVAGCDPHRMGLGPVYSTAKLLRETGLVMKDFDLIELNEAFAAQVIACERAAESKRFAERELSRGKPLGAFLRERMNIHGGAIALGHPVGMTGTRLVLTLLRALRESGMRRGLATLCVGGGQGVSVVVETELEG